MDLHSSLRFGFDPGLNVNGPLPKGTEFLCNVDVDESASNISMLLAEDDFEIDLSEVALHKPQPEIQRANHSQPQHLIVAPQPPRSTFRGPAQASLFDELNLLGGLGHMDQAVTLDQHGQSTDFLPVTSPRRRSENVNSDRSRPSHDDGTRIHRTIKGYVAANDTTSDAHRQEVAEEVLALRKTVQERRSQLRHSGERKSIVRDAAAHQTPSSGEQLPLEQLEKRSLTRRDSTWNPSVSPDARPRREVVQTLGDLDNRASRSPTLSPRAPDESAMATLEEAMHRVQVRERQLDELASSLRSLALRLRLLGAESTSRSIHVQSMLSDESAAVKARLQRADGNDQVAKLELSTNRRYILVEMFGQGLVLLGVILISLGLLTHILSGQ